MGDLPGIDAAGEKIHHLHRLSLGVAVEIPTAGREIDVGQIRPAGGGAQIGSISWQYRRFLPAKGFEIQSRKPALLHLLSGTRQKVPNAQGVSAAAELVSEATRTYIAEHGDQLPIISTACPSVVRLIRVRFPNLIPHMLPLNPPVEVAAMLAVRQAMEKTGLPREKIGIFFISPCPSKVTYVKAPLGNERSQVDRVLAIKDVYPQLLSRMKAVGKDYPEIGTSGKIGISWGRSGGESSGLLSENYLAADGIENVIRVLEDLEDQKFTNLDFIELNACNGGCVGGVLTVENPYVAETKLRRLSRYMPVARTHMTQNAEEVIPWTTGVQYEPVFRLGDTMTESFIRLNQVERLCKKLPGLDCGSCGAPTCKALAEDIVRGQAQETDCVYYLRENLHKLSEEVSLLADDLAEGEKGGQETLRLLKEYIHRISDEMSLLDNREEKEKEEG